MQSQDMQRTGSMQTPDVLNSLHGPGDYSLSVCCRYKGSMTSTTGLCIMSGIMWPSNGTHCVLSARQLFAYRSPLSTHSRLAPGSECLNKDSEIQIDARNMDGKE